MYQVALDVQHVLGLLGSHSMCRGCWGCAVCARIVGVTQRVLDREISAKLMKEVLQGQEIKNLGLGAKLSTPVYMMTNQPPPP